MSSPPLSPSSSLPPPSDDDPSSDLSDWTEVESVNPSLLGDLSDISSDSGSDTHAHERFRTSGFEADESDVEGDERGVLLHSPSLQDSFTDAEFTDPSSSALTSKLGSSLSTLNEGFPASSVELVFPDPGASFSTSSGTISRGPTPHGSTAALIPDAAPRPRAGTVPDKSAKYSPRRGSSPIRRGVNESWLRSSSLWQPPQDLHHEQSDYHLLSSTENVSDIPDTTPSINKEDPNLQLFPVADPVSIPDASDDFQADHSEAEVIEKRTASSEVEEKEVAKVTQEQERTLRQFRRAVATAAFAGLKGGAKKWLPVLAMASVVSLAIFGPFPSSAILQSPHGSLSSLKPEASIIAVDNPPCHSIVPASSSSNLEPISTAKLIPDLQLIRHALSTFSTSPIKARSSLQAQTTAAEPTDAGNTVAEARSNGRTRTSSCHSVAVREQNVALTILAPAGALFDISSANTRSWRQKILGSSSTTAPVTTDDATPLAFQQNCTSEVAIPVDNYDVLAQIRSVFVPAKDYTLLASYHLRQALEPLIGALDDDITEIFCLTRKALYSASRRSQAMLGRATRGAVVSRDVISSTLGRVRASLRQLFFHQAKPDEALIRAQAMFDSLSEYVENQLDNLSQVVEEQAEVMSERGAESIKKAKKGLNRLIRDAKGLAGGPAQGETEATEKVKMDVVRDGPLPFLQSRQGRRERMGRERRPRTARRERKRASPAGAEAKEKGTKEAKEGKTIIYPPPQQPSKAKRFLDIVHHGAVALVL